MPEEYISIAKFASLAGVSSQAVYQRLKRDLARYCSTDDKGDRTISTAALPYFPSYKGDLQDVENEVEKPVEKVVEKVVDNLQSDIVNALTNVQQALVKSLQTQIDDLQRQLSYKDDQIAQKDAQFAALSTRLADLAEKNAQIARNAQLLQGHMQEKAQITAGDTEEAPAPRRSWWGRIFVK